MPRTARIRDSKAIYHCMARSISEFDMFKDDDDKSRFLDILHECKEKHICKIYGYCLMTTHYHILIDANGCDISDFMKSLNQRYVRYVNRKYGRRGSLLAERFNSKIVHDTKNALMVSAYIHNNPKDLQGYSNIVFEYPFSSMGIYLGIHKDIRNLIDKEFLLRCIDERSKVRARTAYAKMVIERRDLGLSNELEKYLKEFDQEQYEYRSYRVVLFRDKNPEEAIKIIAAQFGIEDTSELMHKWKRSTMEFRQASAYALTTFCGMGTKEACEYIKNISATCLAKLRDKGFKLFKNKVELGRLFGI